MSHSPAELLRRHDLRPKKSWGQNFLHDPSIVAAIADAALIEPTDTVVEIGAGLGAMTGALAQRAQHVVAIERDRELVRVLREEFADQQHVEIAEDNALTYQFDHFDHPVVVVGNLPYHIASPLLFHLLDWRRHIRSATLMFQRELAERLAAGPGSRTYGAPSVTCQQYAKVQLCLRVKPGAFIPPPRVDSAVIRLEMREEPLSAADPDTFQLVVRTAFSGRRKMLKRALSPLVGAEQSAQLFEQSDVDPRARAETLSVEQFAQLARSLAKLRTV